MDWRTIDWHEIMKIVDGTKKKRGRPSTGFDKRAYMKEYMRKRRLSLKQVKT